jgi:hypothetical protein
MTKAELDDNAPASTADPEKDASPSVRPILMSAPMVRALLAGSKTQTRRIVKPQPDKVLDGEPYWNVGGFRLRPMLINNPLHCPYGKPGDYLWCKETWALKDCGKKVSVKPEAWPDGWPVEKLQYMADRDDPKAWCWNKRSSMFMPRWASRLTLELTNVEVQQLQAITDYEAILEGGLTLPNRETYVQEKAETDAMGERPPLGDGPRTRFKRLWESMHGPGSWGANPWVWALSFRVHRCNVDDLLKARAA